MLIRGPHREQGARNRVIRLARTAEHILHRCPRESKLPQPVRQLRNSSLIGRFYLHSQLTNKRPMLLIDPAEYVKLGAFHVNLEQVDTRQVILSNDSTHRP